MTIDDICYSTENAMPVQQPTLPQVRIAILFTAVVLVVKLFLELASLEAYRYNFSGIGVG